MKKLLIAALLTSMFGVHAHAQALAPVISKIFTPSSVELDGISDVIITVTNPNAFPISNVQFSDTMPAGVALIVQLPSTCSTVATGGGMFTFHPSGTISSTSSVLAAGQTCNVILRVRGTAVGPHLNTTSQVTATAAPAGGPASATLTVISPDVPAVSAQMLIVLAAVLAGMGAMRLRT